jgi:hypothetical protein
LDNFSFSHGVSFWMDLNKFATGSCRSVLVPKRAAFARMPDGPAPLRTTSSDQHFMADACAAKASEAALQA